MEGRVEMLEVLFRPDRSKKPDGQRAPFNQRFRAFVRDHNVRMKRRGR